MNKKTRITLILSFALFAASVYSLAAAAVYQPVVVQQPTPTIMVSHTDNTPSDAREHLPDVPSDQPYSTKIIKLHRGRVAVFEENSDSPIKILSTEVSDLPDNAIQRLKEGVYAYTAEQYQNYIEDFS